MAETEWVRNLKAEFRSPTTVELSWSLDGSWDDLEQKVWCKNSAADSWDYEYAVHADAKSFTWRDCSSGNSYDFCVGARSKGGSWYYGYLYGVPSDAIVGGLSVTGADAASGDISVEWERNPHASLGRAELWCADEASPWSASPDAVTDSDGFTFEGLPGGRMYWLWVRQRYSESGYTDRQAERVWLPGLANLRWGYAEDRTAVRLTWEANEYLKGISGQGTAASSPTEGAWATVWHEDRSTPGGWVKVDSWIPATTEEYTVAGLKPGHAYRFCVRIRDFGYPVWEEGMYDNDLYTPYVDMPALSKPKAVSNLRAEYSKADGEMRVTWRNNEANAGAVMQPYEGVRVYRSADGGAWEQVYSGEPCEELVEEVARGRSYSYRVVPWNAAGSAPGVESAPVAVAAELPPLAPRAVSAALDAATRRVTVSWSQPESWERPVDEVRVYRQADGRGAYEELGTADGSPYVDQAPEGGHTYRYRVQARNSAGWGPAADTAALYVPPALPKPPTGVEAFVDGTRAEVSWTPAAEDGAPYASVRIERSDNGGAWHQVAVAGGTATRIADEVAANGRYSYRAVAVNAAGESQPSEPSEPVLTQPAAPGRPTAGRSPAGCSVSWESRARYAGMAQVEPSWYDDALYEWVAMPAIDVPSGAASAEDPAPQTDAAMSYRVRSGAYLGEGEVLWSEWSERSEAVAPSSPPAPPSIVYPPAGSVCAADATFAEGLPAGPAVKWRHNPLDGSAQTSAEVRWSFDGKVRGTRPCGPEMSAEASLPLSGVDVYALAGSLGERVYTEDWELAVRTKGASGEWSDWAAVRVRLARMPRAWFEEPSAGSFEGAAAVLSEWPPRVAVGFEGYGYAPVAAGGLELVVADAEGREAARETFPAEADGPTGALLDGSFWSPEPGAEYALSATVTAASGLSASASVRVLADFPRPKFSSLRIECDAERGWAVLVPHVNAADAEGRPVERMDVWRVCGSRSVLVASGVADGQEVVDRFAPLNRKLTYRLGAYSDQGVYMVSEHTGMLRSRRAFAYYGPGYAGIARSRWNLSDRVSVSRSRQTLVDYAGRAYPVLYDGGGVSEVRTVDFVVDGEEEWRALREAAEADGVLFKGTDGEAFRATCSADMAVPDGMPSRFRAVTLRIERVDGEGL